MKTMKIFLATVIITILFVQTNCQNYDSFKVNDPVTYKNLQIFFIRGNDPLIDKDYVPLSEAIEKSYVTIYETGNVQELSVQNFSKHYVYINSGDIIKGGKQDRTIRFDVILPPNSRKLPLNSFCVEAGRWQQRSNEDVNEFSKNYYSLSSSKLKVAAKYKQDQSSVWSGVSEQQDKLNKNVSRIKGKDVDVKSGKSASSLQLTLENKDLKDVSEEYRKHLALLPQNKQNIIGFAYAINGVVYSMDIFNNRGLFLDYWEKLLDAAIIEAISEYSEVKNRAGINDVKNMLAQSFQLESTTEVNNITLFNTYENKHSFLLFVTKDKSENSKWLHKNYLKKAY